MMYKEALYLVYFEEMSYRQAGGVMGKTEMPDYKTHLQRKAELKENFRPKRIYI